MKRQIFNPYLPEWEFIPDGEPRLFDGRVYVYGSHDEARGARYCTGDYVCWSAPEDDLTAWSYEGVIFRRTDDSENADGKALLFAPDVVCGPDGRYYLYYFTSRMDKIGVAVSNTPGGKYSYYGDVHFPDGSTLTQESGFGLPFDPGVLSDESGNWLYYGFAMQKEIPGFPRAGYAGGFVVRLENDMVTVLGMPKKTIPGKMDAAGTCWEGHAFLEASSIRHYGDIFYLVYSSECGHELCYSTSKSPEGPFVYRGVIVSNGDVGIDGRTEESAVNYLGNNHGGMVRIGGQDYIFYHRHTHGHQYSRQGCAEPIIIQEDGSITQTEITSCGLNGGPLQARGSYSAQIVCYLRSEEGILHYSSCILWNEKHPYVALEQIPGAATQQSAFIFNLRDKAVCGFKYFAFEGSESTLTLWLRGKAEGEILLHLDFPKGKVIAKADLFPTENWSQVKTELRMVTGKHALYFEFLLSGAVDFREFEIK